MKMIARITKVITGIHNRRVHVALCFLLVSMQVSIFVTAQESQNVRKVEPFALNQVRLLDSPFKQAQDKDAKYLLSVEPDRLLAKFRINASLEPKQPHYEGWESQTISGHSLGHYLSAVSLMYAATGDERFKQRCDYIVDELVACQEAGKDGLVSAIPNVRKVFEEIKRGEIRSQGFDLNGLWVPWYTQHKVFAGLIDAHRYCNNAKALDVLKTLGDWGIEVTKNLNEEQFQKMCDCEFGGINESYFELYALTGEKKYLDMGDRFYHAKVLDPFFKGVDHLPGKHGNTQFPKVIGIARRYELTGEERLAKMVEFFWDRVVNHHSYVTGGNTMGEHFAQPDRLNDRLSDVTTETCNTHNMLKLTKMLYTWTGDPKYMDFYERATFNHILPSIDLSDDPNKLFTYFVPLKSGGFRTYSDPFDHWTCCHGTGMENHAMYNGMIYFLEKGNVLYINLMIPSTLDWKERGLKISILPDNNILVEAEKRSHQPIEIRIPRNAHILEVPIKRGIDNLIYDGYEIKKPLKSTLPKKVDTVTIRRLWSSFGFSLDHHGGWKEGENLVNLSLINQWQMETMPDNKDRVAFFKGPWLFAADLGAIEKPLADLSEPPSEAKVSLPVLVTQQREAVKIISREKHALEGCCEVGSTAEIDSARPLPVELVPFYNATRRYAVYFDLLSPQWV